MSAAAETYDQPDPRARVVSIDRLVPWPMNPRKTIGDLAELTDAIMQKGILQSLVVRPHRHDDTLEIICGELRWRAAKAAGFDVVPIMLREDLDDDDEALEVNVTENIQRADVHPLEEADGLAALRGRGRSVEEIAAHIGRPTSYVYRRLALAGLCEQARAAFVEGTLTTGAAELVARLVDQGAQFKVLDEITQHRDEDEPLGAEDVRWAIERRSLRLADAPWKLDDAGLVAGVGPCTTCPTRTGAQAALFGEVEEEDRCTDRACWTSKKEAHGEQLIALRKKEGAKVLSATDAKKLYSNNWTAGSSYELEHAGYRDLAHFAPVGARKTWRQVLGDRAVEITVARDPHSGDVHELVRVKDVEKVLAKDPRDGDPGQPDKGSSTKSKGSKSSSSKSSGKGSKAGKKTREQLVEEAREAAKPLILDALKKHIEAGKLPLTDALGFIADEVMRNCDLFELDDAAARRGYERKGASEKFLESWIDAQTKPGPLAALALEILIRADFDFAVTGKGAVSFAQNVVERAGVDWLAIEQAEIEKATAEPGTCSKCGCTETTPCDMGTGEGCAWANDARTLCTACAAPAKASMGKARASSSKKPAAKKPAAKTKGAKASKTKGGKR